MIKINEEKAKLIKRSQLKHLTKRQFNFYLKEQGLLEQVRQLLAQDEDALLEYESVVEIHRSSPTVEKLARALNLSEDTLDSMWERALLL